MTQQIPLSHRLYGLTQRNIPARFRDSSAHTHEERQKLRMRLAKAGLVGIPIAMAAQIAGSVVHHGLPDGATHAEKKALNAFKWEMAGHGVTPGWHQTAHYNPGTKMVRYPAGAVTTALHEYGHSTMERGGLQGLLRHINMPFYALGTRASRGFGLLVPAAVAQTGDGDKAGRRGAIAGAVIAAPFLAEEALANLQAAKKILAVNGLHGILPSLRYLARATPAYSTYVGAAAKLIGAGYGAGKLREFYLHKHRHEGKR